MLEKMSVYTFSFSDQKCLPPYDNLFILVRTSNELVSRKKNQQIKKISNVFLSIAYSAVVLTAPLATESQLSQHQKPQSSFL